MHDIKPMRKTTSRRSFVPYDMRKPCRKDMDRIRRATEEMLWSIPRVVYKMVDFRHLGG